MYKIARIVCACLVAICVFCTQSSIRANAYQNPFVELGTDPFVNGSISTFVNDDAGSIVIGDSSGGISRWYYSGPFKYQFQYVGKDPYGAYGSIIGTSPIAGIVIFADQAQGNYYNALNSPTHFFAVTSSNTIIPIGTDPESLSIITDPSYCSWSSSQYGQGICIQMPNTIESAVSSEGNAMFLGFAGHLVEVTSNFIIKDIISNNWQGNGSSWANLVYYSGMPVSNNTATDSSGNGFIGVNTPASWNVFSLVGPYTNYTASAEFVNANGQMGFVGDPNDLEVFPVIPCTTWPYCPPPYVEEYSYNDEFFASTNDGSVIAGDNSGHVIYLSGMYENNFISSTNNSYGLNQSNFIYAGVDAGVDPYSSALIPNQQLPGVVTDNLTAGAAILEHDAIIGDQDGNMFLWEPFNNGITQQLGSNPYGNFGPASGIGININQDVFINSNGSLFGYGFSPLTISPNPVVLSTGQQLQLTVTLDNVSITNYSQLSFSTINNNNNISVSQQGIVCGLAGTSDGQGLQVIASYYGLTASTNVQVLGLKSLIVTPASISNLYMGSSTQLDVVAIYYNGNSLDVTNSSNYVSNNENIAGVNSSGLVKGNRTGYTNIVVSYGGLNVSVPVNVIPYLKEIYAVPSSISNLKMGSSQQLSVYALYSDNTTVNVTNDSNYISEDNNIATVSSTGFVSGVWSGTTNIDITYDNENTVVPVTIIPYLVSLEATPGSLTIYQGLTGSIDVVGYYSDNTSADVTNSCSYSANNNDVSINKGIVTGVSPGISIVTANYNGIISNAVTINVIGISSIYTVPSGNVVLLSNQYYGQVKCYAVYSDNSTKDVTQIAVWSSSNGSIAYIYNYGLYSGNIGNCQISASFDNLTAEFTVDVKQLQSIEASPQEIYLYYENTCSSQEITLTALYSDNSTSQLSLSDVTYEILDSSGNPTNNIYLDTTSDTVCGDTVPGVYKVVLQYGDKSTTVTVYAAYVNNLKVIIGNSSNR